jgi:hypothetical protein
MQLDLFLPKTKMGQYKHNSFITKNGSGTIKYNSFVLKKNIGENIIYLGKCDNKDARFFFISMNFKKKWDNKMQFHFI